MLLPLAWAVLLAAVADPKPTAYPQADLLIEAGELAKPEVAKQFHLLDTRSPEKYEAGHIPSAVRVNTFAWSKAFVSNPDREAWGKHLAAVLIRDTDTRVVVYGDDLRDAARVWWILRYWGVKDVRLLNGGWQAWEAAKGPVAKGAGPATVGPAVKLTPLPERLASKDFLLEAVKGQKHQILDVRSKAEHCGETETAKRSGAIPGAVHLEWSDAVDPKTGRFKGPDELARMFQKAGIDPGRPTTTYCQSGGRSAVSAFVLELMGAKDVRNYYRSWAEWGNAEDTPIVKPKK